MTQAEQIYEKHFEDAFKAYFLGQKEEKWAIAAIQEALDSKEKEKEQIEVQLFKEQHANAKEWAEQHDKIIRLEKELQELREAQKNTTWESKEFEEAVNVLFESKPLDKTLLKAIEELNELSLALIQFLNKPETVTLEDITEEIVDVEMNLHLLKKHFPVSEEMRSAKLSKFLKSKSYLDYYTKTFTNEK